MGTSHFLLFVSLSPVLEFVAAGLILLKLGRVKVSFHLEFFFYVSEATVSYSQNMDDEYEKLIRRMNPPRVVIDNEACKNATVIQVDSANKHGILLEVVQILTDLNLIVTKAYICSDGGWFMDVFNVTDQEGNKITDEAILDYIRKSLGPDSCFASSMRRSVGVTSEMDHTSIELIGSDRPGLLSEVSAVLTNLKCNVVNAEVWTHNTRAAAIMQVTDEDTGGPITDPERLAMIKKLLCNVLKGSNRSRDAKTQVSLGVTHTERRLHQLMFADRDYEHTSGEALNNQERPNVKVFNWQDKDYSVVSVQCKDRPKLLFDIICTLTDMQYVVFHGNVDTVGPDAYQEYCIRHIDGSPVKSDAERQRVIQCLEAAILRRVSEGLKLELCTTDRTGLLSDVTRIFRENSLTVTRAEVTTRGGKAVNTFYVRDASGYPVDAKIVESVRQTIGLTILRVKGSSEALNPAPPQESPTRFLFGGLFKSRSFCNFGLVRSYS
nr:ACT domain-containing protein ACR4-like isoform X1 [Ipomoea batatas]